MDHPELHRISSQISIVQAYDPTVKTDLFSTVLSTAGGLFLIDPIRGDRTEMREEIGDRPVAGIVITNANHIRASADYSEQFRAPVFARAEVFGQPEQPARFNEIKAGDRIASELDVIAIEGAAAGEIALYHQAKGGTIIVGDALINIEPHGFSFLPSKYCLDQKRMRLSLRQLLDKPAERMLFAHGTPMISGTSKRLRELLETDR